MSATSVRSHSSAPVHTTCRGAALYITIGVVLLTLGCAWLLSLIAGQDSYALSQMGQMVRGLGGPLCLGLPLLSLWAGAKMMVSARHRVGVRGILIVAGLYVLVLSGFTLTATVHTGRLYMDDVYHAVNAAPRSTGFLSQYSGFLGAAYGLGANGAGGLIGMALAYPLWRFLTVIGADLVVVILMATLLFVLIRQNPIALIGRFADWINTRRQATGARQQQKTAPEAEAWPEETPQEEHSRGYTPAPQPQPAAPLDQPAAPPPYYQPGPIYDTHSYPPPVQQPVPGPDGFYQMQPGSLNDPYAPQMTGRVEAPAPGLWDTPAPEQAEPPRPVQPAPSWGPEPTNPAYPPPYPGAQQADPTDGQRVPTAEIPDPADAAGWKKNAASQESTPADPEASPAPKRRSAAKPSVRRGDKPASTAQALDEDEEDLPWEAPPYLSASPASPLCPPPCQVVPRPESAPAPREKNGYRPDAEDAAQFTAQGISAERPDPSRGRKTEPRQAAASAAPKSGEAQPVYTDPAVPLQGERIPITPRRDKRDGKARMDGTSAPTVRQDNAGWLVPYQAPPIRLLNDAPKVSQSGMQQEDDRRARIIEETLRSFSVESTVQQIMHGPSVTQFAIQIAPGVKVSKVTGTADNLALELKAENVRVEAPIKGTNFIGIEVPNQQVSRVSLKEVLESPEMRNNPSPLLVALGKSISGAPVLCDLSKMPHLLIAGATGSGKSVCINSIVCSLLYRTSPEQVRMIMIDPKQVELSVYNPIPHLLVPVISDPKKAAGALSWVVQEMLERYSKFSGLQVRNIAGYNKAKQASNPSEKLPSIVVIIDEMADLMEVCRKDVEESIRRLAALARAAGIYMVLATQRPSVDVITGVIKNNIPSRIAFAVSSGTDSRTIIDMVGAEKLIGKGDMLYKPTGATATRVQGCFVSDEEVNAIAEHIGSRYHTEYDPNIAEHLESAGRESAADDAGDDGNYGGGGGASGNEAEFSDLLQQAIEMAVEDGQTSTSMLQRRLRVGYARAGRLIDEMEKRGIISCSEGSKPRKTLITREQYVLMQQD